MRYPIQWQLASCDCDTHSHMHAAFIDMHEVTLFRNQRKMCVQVLLLVLHGQMLPCVNGQPFTASMTLTSPNCSRWKKQDPMITLDLTEACFQMIKQRVLWRYCSSTVVEEYSRSVQHTVAQSPADRTVTVLVRTRTSPYDKLLFHYLGLPHWWLNEDFMACTAALTFLHSAYVPGDWHWKSELITQSSTVSCGSPWPRHRRMNNVLTIIRRIYCTISTPHIQ